MLLPEPGTPWLQVIKPIGDDLTLTRQEVGSTGTRDPRPRGRCWARDLGFGHDDAPHPGQGSAPSKESGWALQPLGGALGPHDTLQPCGCQQRQAHVDAMVGAGPCALPVSSSVLDHQHAVADRRAGGAGAVMRRSLSRFGCRSLALGLSSTSPSRPSGPSQLTGRPDALRLAA